MNRPSRRLDAVDVEQVELVRVRLPLVHPFRTSFGVQHERDALLVHVQAHSASGWGECVAPAAPVFSEEFADGAQLVLREHLVGAVLDGPITTEDVEARIRHVHGNRMAKAALSTAILDAQLVAAGVSLAAHLGAVRTRVPAGVSVGIPDGGVAELVDQIAGFLEDGYLRIKAKIRPGFDVEPMRAVRETFGDTLELQVDANCAYDPEDPGHHRLLDGLDELGMVLIEQPYAADRLADHARLAGRLRTPICLDESIVDAARARDAIESGACAIVNIKVGRVGGIREAVEVRDVCAQRDVPVWCGGMLETGVGRAVNVALAALDGFELPGDVSASDRYFARDLTEPFVLVDGHLDVPDRPGIGRSPIPELLADARRTIVASR